MDGVLVIDKPAGPTSHDVVATIRRLLRLEKVGHTGTLDPMATGVLPLVIGRATRLAQFLSAADKTYEAEIRLGITTDTWDAAGASIAPREPAEVPTPDPEAIRAALSEFSGSFLQAPPPYSAKKIEGTRAYTLARRNVAVEPRPVRVTVHDLTLESVAGDRVRLRVSCSAGFYVRSLAHELGLRLGTGAHLASLRRTRSGEFALCDTVTLASVDASPAAAADRIVPMERLLTTLPGVTVTPLGAQRVAHGNQLSPSHILRGWPLPGARNVRVRLLDPGGFLLGIGQSGDDPGILRPAVVLV